MNSMMMNFGNEAEIIDVAEETKRSYWAKKLGVTADELKSAVRATRSLEYAQLKAYLQKYRWLKKLRMARN